MAYYSSNFYEGDAGEFYRTPSYTTSYGIVPFQDSSAYSSYEFTEPGFTKYNSPAYYGDAYDPIHYSTYSYIEPKLLEYNSSSYVDTNDPFQSRSDINYSSYNFNEPKLLQHHPIPYNTSYFSSQTQYVVSYSTTTAGLDDIEFKEYDPTPYGGGYDPALTYGKPLPPSDEICYPRSSPEYNGLSLDNFSYASIPSPYGNDDIDDFSEKPRNGTKPTKSPEEPQQPEKPIESNRGEEGEGYTCDDGYNPWSGYGYGGRNGRDKDCGSRYGYDELLPPNGYGLEAMDFCESLFGYWPCLCRNNRRNYGNQEVGSEERQENQWMGAAADCLFGSPYAHYGGDGVFGNYGGPTCDYERHYQGQHYRQLEGDENSWL